MFETSVADPEIDIFAMSRRPLKVRNCNTPPQFEPNGTRINLASTIFDERKKYFESITNNEILPRISPKTTVSTQNELEYQSDHFNRDIIPFAFPKSSGKPVPFYINHKDSEKMPHYNLDLPCQSLRISKKIFLSDIKGLLGAPSMPECDICAQPLTYPYMASLTHNICLSCISAGNLPIQESSLDFIKIDDPKNIEGSWTIEETNALLTYIENNTDDWAEIAAALKTHTAEECLLHFVRLQMYDPYYIGDPSLVPDNVEYPDEIHMLPFMIAPDPIASFVEFVHEVNIQIGNKIAEIAQRAIESTLSDKTGTVFFQQIPDILIKLLKATGEEAGNLCYSECAKLLEIFDALNNALKNNAQSLYRDYEVCLSEIETRGSKTV